MTADHRPTVTVVVRCGFIGCDWRMEIGTAPMEAHHAYLDHLDVHDPDHIAQSEHDAEVARALAEDRIPAGTVLCTDPACVLRSQPHSHPEGWPEHPSYKGGLYAGDTDEQIADGQAPRRPFHGRR